MMIKRYDSFEAQRITEELRHLFALQDKPCTDAKVAVFVQEFELEGLPYKAVIAGVKSLFHEELKTIKYAQIRDAVRKFIDFDAERVVCEDCNGEGAVILYDDKLRPFALACTCSNGDICETKQGLVRWTGQRSQVSKNRTLSR